MKRINLFLIILLLIKISLFCDPINTFRLDHLSLSDGLPNSSVSKILQDSEGFMWIGTQSGLSRYNGYDFKTYLNDPFDSNSLPHNLIQTMYLDDDDENILWLGTYNGLSRMDLDKDNFTNFPSIDSDDNSLSDDVVVAIERDNQGRLWVGTLNGLNLFDEKSGTFKRFFYDPENPRSIPHNTVRSLLSDNNGNLWIGTYGGLSRWDEQTSSFTNFKPVENDLNSIPSVYVMDIIQSPESDDQILIGTWGGGVAQFNTKTNVAIRYEIPDMRVYTVLFDDQKRVWAGSWGGGLSILSLKDGSYTHFEKGSSSELSHNIIYSLYQDFSGVVWIGTNGGGINKYVDWKNQYTFYTNNPDDPLSIPPGKVVMALEDSKSRLWFGVQGSGLSLLNREKGIFTNYSHNESDSTSLSNSTINAIYEDHQGKIWIGTNDGLNQYLEESDSFKRFYAGEKDASLPENLVYTIIEDKDNNFWLGSYTKGLSVLNRKTGEFSYYKNDKDDPASLSDNLIRSMFVDSQGIVWVCTNKGLNRFLPEQKSFKRYMHDESNRLSISSNDVRSVFEDSEGVLWIATNGGGVNIYDRNSDSFTLISTLDGLLSNSVIGIEEDSNGNLLFLTQAGISLYNKTEKVFTVIDEKTGLLSSELTSGYIHASDGTFFIGSNEGITQIPYFKENDEGYIPIIHISGISVLGIPYDENELPIWKTKEISLKYNENTIAFDFVINDFSSERQNQFAYKLDGVDSSWVYSGVRNFARYTQLKPGNYTFRVIGADSRNNWNNFGTSINLKISPPLWFSAFAYIIYFIIAVLVVILLIIKIKKRELEAERKIDEQKALNIELENRVKRRTAQIEEAREIAENATKAKSIFLANMSHELRTPLNAVIGFSALLNEEDFSPEKKHIINSIKTAGKSLSTLINDLLDLSKIEVGKMTIKYAPVHLSKVLFEIKHIFELRVKEKNISLQIELDRDLPQKLMLDETRFRQILINLTGNAIKFTDTGWIKISLKRIDRNRGGTLDLELSVEDTGCGISEQEKVKIFDLFWQKEDDRKNKTKGTGLGLSITKNLVKMMSGEISVQSTPGKGSLFTAIFHNIEIVETKSEKNIKSSADEFGIPSFENIKALIVDDMDENRKLLQEIMNQLKIESLMAVNGEEAMRLLDEYKPEIIFMDVQMPVMDGLKAARLIKENPRTKNIPIVAVSASIESDFYDSEGNSEYFSDYISKPYFVKKITDVLIKILNFHHYTIENIEADKPHVYNNNEIIEGKELFQELVMFQEQWSGLKATGRMSKLEEFGIQLMQIGKSYNANILVDYSEKLLTYVKLFDLPNIEIELNRFPEIIEKLKL